MLTVFIHRPLPPFSHYSKLNNKIHKNVGVAAQKFIHNFNLMESLWVRAVVHWSRLSFCGVDINFSPCQPRRQQEVVSSVSVSLHIMCRWCRHKTEREKKKIQQTFPLTSPRRFSVFELCFLLRFWFISPHHIAESKSRFLCVRIESSQRKGQGADKICSEFEPRTGRRTFHLFMSYLHIKVKSEKISNSTGGGPTASQRVVAIDMKASKKETSERKAKLMAFMRLNFIIFILFYSSLPLFAWKWNISTLTWFQTRKFSAALRRRRHCFWVLCFVWSFWSFPVFNGGAKLREKKVFNCPVSVPGGRLLFNTLLIIFCWILEFCVSRFQFVFH